MGALFQVYMLLTEMILKDKSFNVRSAFKCLFEMISQLITIEKF